MREEWTNRNEVFISPANIFPKCMKSVKKNNCKNIWMYWDKKNLPPLVQLCKKTFEKLNPHWNVHIVTPQNVFDYLYETDLPNTWKNFGRPAHQSDAVRVALLCR